MKVVKVGEKTQEVKFISTFSLLKLLIEINLRDFKDSWQHVMTLAIELCEL